MTVDSSIKYTLEENEKCNPLIYTLGDNSRCVLTYLCRVGIMKKTLELIKKFNLPINIMTGAYAFCFEITQVEENQKKKSENINKNNAEKVEDSKKNKEKDKDKDEDEDEDKDKDEDEDEDEDEGKGEIKQIRLFLNECTNRMSKSKFNEIGRAHV